MNDNAKLSLVTKKSQKDPVPDTLSITDPQFIQTAQSTAIPQVAEEPKSSKPNLTLQESPKQSKNEEADKLINTAAVQTNAYIGSTQVAKFSAYSQSLRRYNRLVSGERGLLLVLITGLLILAFYFGYYHPVALSPETRSVIKSILNL